ncbi:uncharacterized protein ACNS7B_024018 [Menidia menidia]
MSFNIQIAKCLLLFVITAHFYSFMFCSSKSLTSRPNVLSNYRVEESATAMWDDRQEKHRTQGQQPAAEHVTDGSSPRKDTQLGPPLRHDLPEDFLALISDLKLDEVHATLNGSFWTPGNVSVGHGSPAQDSDEGYQADFTGYLEVQGEVSYPRSYIFMKPLVKCIENVMIFTASGQGLTHLLVDRGRASPISILQLPAYCGYMVKATWNNLEIMAPYDGCYITHENGSYVLHMVWMGSPLKLSCPMMPTEFLSLSPPSTAVFCSPYGMAVQLHGQKRNPPQLRVLVDGAWSPFVSDLCALQTESQSKNIIFVISYNAPCITVDNGLQLKITLNDQEYDLSCPVFPQLSHKHSQHQPPTSLPSYPWLSFITDPTHTVPSPPLSSPPKTQNQQQTAHIPNHHYYAHPGLQYHHLPMVYRPVPQFSHPLQPTIKVPQRPQQPSQYPSGPDMSGHYFNGHPQYPYLIPRDHFHHQVPKLSTVSSQYEPHPLHSYGALAPTMQEKPRPLASYQPALATAPTTKAPSPFPSPSPLKQPTHPQHQTSPLKPQLSYYAQWLVSHPALHPSASFGIPTASTRGSSTYPSNQFYDKHPPYFPPPKHLPPAKGKPQKPHAPQITCRSSSDPSCGYHHIFQPQDNDRPHPSLPSSVDSNHPKMEILSATTSPPWLTPHTPSLQCLKGRLVVFLPFADPASIQVREHLKKWMLLSSVSELCGYMVQIVAGYGVILYSPLPACHSQFEPPSTISLHIRYWDLSIWQNRTWDLRCPYQSVPETQAPAIPSTIPLPPSTTKDESSQFVMRTEVLCMPQQMNVVLPPGPISEIAVTDIKGNQVNLLEASKDCGYHAEVAKDGKIHLTLQLHSHCQMSVQGTTYIITVIYMTESGRKEAHVSCPVVIPRSGNECDLHSEYRLPCGSGSVSQTECLSMGCCFNKHPPTCHYPMDECTIDRHMIFYVPASLTDPPLSPALLVAANNSTCTPEKATSDYALFNIPMDGCGTRRVVVGKTVVYMVEITNMIHAVSLNYGTITRDTPVRLLVECRYVPGTALSVSYMVKTPSLGPEIHTQGVFGVQLRIAQDAHYSSYYPQYHQPLHMLLGKPLHLEVRLLNSPDPSLVLLVHFCVAYPRSGKAVWVLLYNGCPNPLDPEPSKAVLSYPKAPAPQSQTRRFTVSTFQFLPDGEFQDTDEEIYFMCSTEICSPHNGPCVEGCFAH